jgi:ferredoxin
LLLGLSALAVGAFFVYDQPFAFSQFTVLHWLVIGCTIVSFVIEVLALLTPSPQKVHSIDAILCSYSGNTAHYFQHFRQGFFESEAEVRVHRFEHHNTFDAELHGDALVIVFPVFGWKMPWPLLEYLLLRLPRGNGKPAYIIYTAGGGPENAGFVAWVLLTLKGYRVLGKVWSIYPINIATVRLGPKRFWKWFDRLLPFRIEEECAQRAGQAFANGRSAGMPILLWPFPLFVIGILIENPIVNRIYHHYVWKRRCTRCGLCIRHCPSGRLYKDDNGYPRAKGECILCLRCINICPTNAMHVLGLSEYGAPYPLKWPALALPKSSDLKRNA